MATLDTKQTGILRLILRSKEARDAEGWYRISRPIWPLVNGCLPTDLAETRAHDGEEGGGYLRLTERGHAVADYLP